MSDTASRTPGPAQDDAADREDTEYLRQLGVEPRFKRALGFFTGSLFAIAFQGPTTGALLITGATVALGGPAFIWAIPVIFVLQLLLALTWAELSSHYPLTGGIYQWASRLGGDFLGWMTGLFYVVAIVLVMPAVGQVVGVILASLFTSLKLTTTTVVVISIITIGLAAVMMATSVRVVAILNSIGVVLELVVLLGAAVGLLFHTHQCLSVLTKTGGVQGTGSYLFPFLVVVALVVTQLVGFETAGAFAEETAKSRIKPSQAIIAGLGGTALILFIFDFALLLAIPGVGPAMKDPELIPDVLTSALGSGFTKLFLVAALIAVFSTAVATLATIVRMIYGMARNDQLPGAAFLTRLSDKTTEPIGAIVVATVLSIIPLIFIKTHPGDRGLDHGADHHPVHPGTRRPVGAQAAGLASAARQVQPGPVGNAGDDRRAGLDDHHPARRRLATRGHQSDARPAAGHRGPRHRRDRRRADLVVRPPAGPVPGAAGRRPGVGAGQRSGAAVSAAVVSRRA